MNKFTLFTLFVSGIIVVIVAEMMVNDYLRTPNSLDGAASVLQAQSSGLSQQNGPNSNSSGTTNAQAPSKGANGAIDTGSTGNSANLVGSITNSLLQKAGLQNYTFKPVAYDGKLFGRIAFTDVSFITSHEAGLAKNETATVATFYEFDPDSAESAKEIYDLMKQKCSGEIGVILNETNSFGDDSFYVNYFEYPEKVFLVFRKGTRVFAFNYTKDLHQSIVKLIGLL